MATPRLLYQSFSITVERHGVRWRAKVKGIGALSAWHPTAAAAVAEVTRYLDEADAKVVSGTQPQTDSERSRTIVERTLQQPWPSID